MMKFFIFGLYNLVYQLFTFIFLLFANTYLNNLFIPDKFRWSQGEIKKDLTLFAISQFVILIIESFIFLVLLHSLNKFYFSTFLRDRRYNDIVFWVSIIYSAITLLFTCVLMYVSFKEI
jgi:hypothetical protein